MKAVNKFLEKADKAIETCEILQNNEIKRVYKGYVSGFAAMVIQNGLPAALAINMPSDGEGKERKKIVEAIASILNKTNAEALLKESCEIEKSPAKSRLLKEDVINASIALKLMMRTYRFTKEKEEN